MTKTNYHFALFLNDTPMPEVISISGDYIVQYKAIFEKAAKNKNIMITWDAFDVVKESYPSLEEIKKYDAIILTGSKYNAHDNDSWIMKLLEFLKVILNKKDGPKLVGFCFGHQIILRAAGGKTIKNPAGWEVGLSQIELNKEGQNYFNSNKQFINIHQFHQDHVSIIPKGFKTLGFTKGNTPNQITISDKVITIQGHPEFTKETVKIMIKKRKETGILTPEFADKSLDVLKHESIQMDDVWFTEKVLDFITFAQ